MRFTSIATVCALMLLSAGATGCRKPTSPGDVPTAPISTPSSGVRHEAADAQRYAPSHDAENDDTVVEEVVYTIISVDHQAPQLAAPRAVRTGYDDGYASLPTARF